MGKIDHEGGRKIPAEDFFGQEVVKWPLPAAVPLITLTQHRREDSGLRTKRRLLPKALERDAHVVVDELNADPHARAPALINSLPIAIRIGVARSTCQRCRQPAVTEYR